MGLGDWRGHGADPTDRARTRVASPRVRFDRVAADLAPYPFWGGRDRLVGHTWFVGVTGADPAQMRLVKDFPISPDLPASMFNPTTGTSDGVAVTTVASEPFGRATTAAQYRVSRSGGVLDEQGPMGIDDSELADGPQIESTTSVRLLPR